MVMRRANLHVPKLLFRFFFKKNNEDSTLTNKEIPPHDDFKGKGTNRLTPSLRSNFLDCKRKGEIKKITCYFKIICEFLSPRPIPLYTNPCLM